MTREAWLLTDCPFCDYAGPSPMLAPESWKEHNGVIVFEPINPVVPGHVLVVPTCHVEDASDDPGVTGRVFKAASRWVKRDVFTCQYCGAKAPDVVLHVDHVRPVSRGGSNKRENLTTSCQDCNLGKGSLRLPDYNRDPLKACADCGEVALLLPYAEKAYVDACRPCLETFYAKCVAEVLQLEAVA